VRKKRKVNMGFEMFGLSEPLMKAVMEMGFEIPTPIQEQGLPLLLQGEDLVGQAQTGTGKTAAFGLCILERWMGVKPQDKPPFRQGCATPYALIMAPTRELAIQVGMEMNKLGKFTGAHMVPIYGGQELEKQTREFGRPVDIVVGTPGRILDHLQRGSMDLSRVQVLVLDEADRMLDMGFMDDVVDIIKRTPATRQTLMFSATMPREVINVSYEYMKSPQSVKVSEDKITVDKIRQYYVEVPDPRHRLPLLLGFLKEKQPKLAIIFARTKRGADRLGEILDRKGFKAMTLHGDLTQRQRDHAMQMFREGKIHVLVATDLASRGLDVFDVSHVINYDLPEEHTTYIHRIGRTGRAGAEGEAVSFAFPDQKTWMEELEKMTGVKVEKIEVQADGDVPRMHDGGHSRFSRESGYGRGAPHGPRESYAKGEGHYSGGHGEGRGEGHSGRPYGSREGGHSHSASHSYGREGGYGGGSRGGYGRDGPSNRGGSFGGEGSGGRSFGGGVSGQTLRKIKDRPLKQAESKRSTRHGHTYVGREA